MSPRRLPVAEPAGGAISTRLLDGAYMAWQSAQILCDIAFNAWRTAGPGLRAGAHLAYCAALDREEAAAHDFAELSQLASQAA
jgi:hypothetical protein